MTLKRRNIHLTDEHMRAARKLSPKGHAADGVREALERISRHRCPQWGDMPISMMDPEFEACTCKLGPYHGR